MKGLIAKKVGMTQVFDEAGNLTPVTVIRVEPNTVIARKTKETAGYDAVVLGLDDLKKNSTFFFNIISRHPLILGTVLVFQTIKIIV